MAPERTTAVVVPALNEERVIGRCLQALTLQDVGKGSFEVVVVDNGSTDRTVEIARSFSGALNLTVLVKPGARISALRNFGVARSAARSWRSSTRTAWLRRAGCGRRGPC